MISENCEVQNEKNDTHNYRFRPFLSQFLASTVKGVLMFLYGLCFSLPTIVIPALTGIQNEHNRNEFLTITSVEVSWLGSFMYLVIPIGSVLSAPLIDPLGRRLSMILVNIPYLIGWYLLYRASVVWEVFAGFTFLGLAIGLMEAPIVTYVGEICQPSFRGFLIGYTHNCFTIGVLVLSLLNTMMPWRTVCLICLIVPIITVVLLLLIPETPQWLLSKNRITDAENSLRWLRGWVSSEMVAQEFNDLQQHSKRSKSCDACIEKNLECFHPLPTFSDKIVELKRKRTLKPLFIVVIMFFLSQFSILGMKPYMMQIFRAYDSPIQPDQAVAIMSSLDIIGNVMFTFLVRFTGKRRLCLFCMTGILICTAIITWFGYTYLPQGYMSFDQAQRKPFHLENIALRYIPMICLFSWSFLLYCSLTTTCWLLVSELFSFKSRSVASAISSAMNYIFGFMSKKAYYNLEATLSLSGVSLLYTLICLFGLILIYSILPETENLSLEDIELHFSDNSKGLFTDRKITKSKHKFEAECVDNGNNSEIKSDLSKKCREQLSNETQF